MQKVKKTMPSRTGIPPDAQAEILQKLSAETKITSCEIAEILKKHDVCGDMDALQDAYRKRLGQRLLSGIRDEKRQAGNPLHQRRRVCHRGLLQ